MTHFYCLAVEAGFYSDVVECLPIDPAAQVRFPPRAVWIFLHPVTNPWHGKDDTEHYQPYDSFHFFSEMIPNILKVH